MVMVGGWTLQREGTGPEWMVGLIWWCSLLPSPLSARPSGQQQSFCFIDVQLLVLVAAPVNKLMHLLSVGWFVSAADEAPPLLCRPRTWWYGSKCFCHSSHGSSAWTAEGSAHSPGGPQCSWWWSLKSFYQLLLSVVYRWGSPVTSCTVGCWCLWSQVYLPGVKCIEGGEIGRASCRERV